MKPQPLEWDWPDTHESVSRTELAQACRISIADVDELMQYGAIAARSKSGGEPVFSAHYIGPIRTVVKLKADFDLDLFSAALLLGYVQRIEELEKEVRSLRARSPSHIAEHHEGPAPPWREPHARI